MFGTKIQSLLRTINDKGNCFTFILSFNEILTTDYMLSWWY